MKESLAYRSFAEQTQHYFSRDHCGLPMRPVESSAAWRGMDMRAQPHRWRMTLSSADIDELSRAADTLINAAVPLRDVRRTDFSIPNLEECVADWRQRLADESGFILISGAPVDEWGEVKASYVFWGLGHHLGWPGAQNMHEELLGHVRDSGDTNGQLVRQYRTTETIGFHCDAADVVGLMCLHTARAGGLSRIVSSVTVFNQLLAQNPSLAHRLFEPFALDRRNENPSGAPGHVPIQPACLGTDGVLRTFYHGGYFRSAQRFDDVQLDQRALACLDAYDALCEDPDNHLEMWLAAGDMQFISNHVIVHARTGFQDWPEPERKRHLLRLWLSI